MSIKLNPFTAVGIVEGYIDCDSDETYIAAIQLLIDTGLAFRLQGYFGRVAMLAIERGDCVPPVSVKRQNNG